MKIFIMIALLEIALFGSGEGIYKEKCASCHAGYIPMGTLKENFVEFNNTKLKLKGPTLNQLSFRLKQKIGDPAGDREFHMMEVTEFIKSYIYHPDKQKSVCMDEVLAAFDTMPSMKGQISDAEAQAVAAYIYGYGQQVQQEHAPKYVHFAEAVKEAKKEHKLIMIKASSEHCHFCQKMDREVLSLKKVKKKLHDDFVLVEIDVYQSALPLGLKTEVTPTYFFLTPDAKLLKRVPGSWNAKDFLEILQEVKKLSVLNKHTYSLRLRRKTAVESFTSVFIQNTQLKKGA